MAYRGYFGFWEKHTMGKCKLTGHRIAIRLGKEKTMAEKNEDVIAALNDLVETCKDAEQGFRTAAERAGKDWDPDFRTLLNVLAQQRARFAAELQNEVLRRGGDPAKSGHVSEGFQRGWMNLNLLLTGSSQPSIVEEC